MLHRKEQVVTPEEYLAAEEKAEIRHEYYHGEIFAISGGSANHNRIARNLLVALDTALEGKACEVFIGDLRLLVKENGLYTYRMFWLFAMVLSLQKAEPTPSPIRSLFLRCYPSQQKDVIGVPSLSCTVP